MKPGSYTARTPEDLIALAPYLLGFHPTESVVVLTFGAPGGSFHARVDLPDGPDDRAEVCGVICHAVRRNRAPVTAVLVFSDHVERSRAVCADLVPALVEAGASVIDAIRADGHCWWSVLDADPEPHPYDVSCHPFTAAQVFEGNAALASRAELAGTLVGSDPAEAESVGRAAVVAVDTLVSSAHAGPARAAVHAQAQWLCDRLARAARDGELLPTDDAGRALALVRLPELRDVAWARVPRDQARVHVDLWRDLVRRAPPDLVPAAAAVLGFLAWLAGDGALAWCAVDRCLEADPGDNLAHRVADLLQGAVPPTSWTPVPAGDLPVLDDWTERAS